MKEKLLIFPFNGNALEALDCISADKFELIGFVDDTPSKQGMTSMGIPVFGREAFDRFPEAKVLAVPGSPTSYPIRDKIISDLGIDFNRFTSIIHPRATVSPLAKIGYNSLIMAGVVITSNSILGNHVCVLPNTVIHHDSNIGDYTLVGSNITVAGGTTIGKNCYIGSGTSVINGISIGDYSLVGMGSNVIKSISPNSKAVGNPARLL